MALLKPSHALRVVFVGIVGTWIACADEPPVGPKPLPKAVTNADVSQASEHPTAWDIAAYTLSAAQWEDNHGTAEGTYIVDLYPSQGLPPQGWHQNVTEQAVSIPDIGFSIRVTKDSEDAVVDYRPFEVVAVPAIDAPWGTDAPSPGTIQVKFTPIASVVGEGTESEQPTPEQQLWNAIFVLQDQWNSLYLWGFYFDLLADPFDEDARAKALRDLRQRAEQRVKSSNVGVLYSAISRMEDVINRENPVVLFGDAIVEAAVRQAVSIPQGSIRRSHLASLTELDLSDQNVANFVGLEHATALISLDLDNSGITDALLASLVLKVRPNLETLDLQNTMITDLSLLLSVNSLSEVWLTGVTTLTIRSKILHVKALRDRGVTVHYNPVVTFTDSNLEREVRAALGRSSGDIRASDMANFTGTLNLDTKNIASLAGLEYATGMRELNLRTNNVVDVSPLEGLISLTKLDLGVNDVEDVFPLAGLTKLTEINLRENVVEDVSPLAGLVNLATLVLVDNDVVDVSPLTGLTQLTNLDLRTNQITNPSPLGAMTWLTTLDLGFNQIASVSGLATLTKLTELNLAGNEVADASPLKTLVELRTLRLDSNRLTSISALKTLVELRTLRLDSNRLTSISALNTLVKMNFLELQYNRMLVDISGVSGMTPLGVLNLSNTAVVDLGPLTSLTGMVQLVLTGITTLSSESTNTHIPTIRTNNAANRGGRGIVISGP